MEINSVVIQVLNRVFGGKQWSTDKNKINCKTWTSRHHLVYGNGKCLHVQFREHLEGTHDTAHCFFNIVPKDFVADYELWICLTEDKFYLLRKTDVKRMYGTRKPTRKEPTKKPIKHSYTVLPHLDEVHYPNVKNLGHQKLIGYLGLTLSDYDPDAEKLTLAQYKQAINSIGDNKQIYKEMLCAQHGSKDQTVTARQLATIIGRETSVLSIRNSYNELGRAISEHSGIQPPRTGEEWEILSTGEKTGGILHWILRPELAQALEDLSIVSETYKEGAPHEVRLIRNERNPVARRKCIDFYKKDGRICCRVCSFDFGKQYGPKSEGYIHVHHLNPLKEIKREYKVCPETDLIPVCPNCHAVFHKQSPPFTVIQVKDMLKSNQKK